MDFKKINEQVTSADPYVFLTAALSYEQPVNAAIIFSQTIEEKFEQALSFLASDETISFNDLSQWKEHNFLVVAQTIDGDYIAGTTNQTFIIPVSLYTADIEIYNLFLSDFFCRYTSGLIHSALLPKYQ